MSEVTSVDSEKEMECPPEDKQTETVSSDTVSKVAEEISEQSEKNKSAHIEESFDDKKKNGLATESTNIQPTVHLVELSSNSDERPESIEQNIINHEQTSQVDETVPIEQLKNENETFNTLASENMQEQSAEQYSNSVTMGTTVELPQGERQLILQQTQDPETGEMLVILQGENGEQIAIPPEALQSGFVQITDSEGNEQVIALSMPADGQQLVMMNDGTYATAEPSTLEVSADILNNLGAASIAIPSQAASTPTAATNVVQSIETPRVSTQEAVILSSAENTNATSQMELDTMAETGLQFAKKVDSEIAAGELKSVQSVDDDNKEAEHIEKQEQPIMQIQGQAATSLETLVANALANAGNASSTGNYVIMTGTEEPVATPLNLEELNTAGQTFYLQTPDGLVACTAAANSEDGSIQILTGGVNAAQQLVQLQTEMPVNASKSDHTSVSNGSSNKQKQDNAIEILPVSANTSSEEQKQNIGSTKKILQSKPNKVVQFSGETVYLQSNKETKINSSGTTITNFSPASAIVRKRIQKSNRSNVSVTITKTTGPSTNKSNEHEQSKITATTRTNQFVYVASNDKQSKLSSSMKTYSRRNIVWLNPVQSKLDTTPSNAKSNEKNLDKVSDEKRQTLPKPSSTSQTFEITLPSNLSTKVSSTSQQKSPSEKSGDVGLSDIYQMKTKTPEKALILPGKNKITICLQENEEGEVRKGNPIEVISISQEHLNACPKKRFQRSSLDAIEKKDEDKSTKKLITLTEKPQPLAVQKPESGRRKSPIKPLKDLPDCDDDIEDDSSSIQESFSTSSFSETSTSLGKQESNNESMSTERKTLRTIRSRISLSCGEELKTVAQVADKNNPITPKRKVGRPPKNPQSMPKEMKPLKQVDSTEGVKRRGRPPKRHLEETSLEKPANKLETSKHNLSIASETSEEPKKEEEKIDEASVKFDLVFNSKRVEEEEENATKINLKKRVGFCEEVSQIDTSTPEKIALDDRSSKRHKPCTPAVKDYSKDTSDELEETSPTVLKKFDIYSPSKLQTGQKRVLDTNTVLNSYVNAQEQVNMDDMQRLDMIQSLYDTRNSQEVYDEQKTRTNVHYRVQKGTAGALNGLSGAYMCQKCGYQTSRMNNLILHHKDDCHVVKNQMMLYWRNEMQKQTKTDEQRTPISKKRRLLDATKSDKQVPTDVVNKNETNESEDFPTFSLSEEEDEHQDKQSDNQRNFGFDTQEIVWAEWKDVKWPALVMQIFPKEETALVKLIENSDENSILVKISTLETFDRADRNINFLEQGKESIGDRLVTAVQKAEDYTRKRCLGEHIDAWDLLIEMVGNEYSFNTQDPAYMSKFDWTRKAQVDETSS